VTRYGFDDVSVRFGNRTAVHHVTLDVRAGMVTALVGGDGAGKTTLLRCMAGRVRPFRGTVHTASVRATGVLTADPPGYGDLTVSENLAFVAKVRGLDRRTARDRAAALLASTDLTDAADRLADNLSGGMRRKLGFALATLHRPDLLLLDEPTTGLDPVSRTELWRLMATAARDGTVIVLATTYLDEAERCAQVLALDRGDVLAHGEPDTIIDRVRSGLYRSPTPGPPGRSWRRGGTWRVWSPEAPPPQHATAVEADLEDAVVVAMLDRASHSRPSEEVV
jgi:ABC-2 type transport system ATP-binding protein